MGIITAVVISVDAAYKCEVMLSGIIKDQRVIRGQRPHRSAHSR